MRDEHVDEKLQWASNELARLDKPFFFPPGIPLQVDVEGVNLRMKSTSIGYFADRFLVIKYPVAHVSISTALSKGSRMTVRYVDNGTVFAFVSEVIAITYDTVNTVFISYPSRIVRQELRSTRRIDCHLPSRIMRRNPEPAPETPLGDGFILDISLSGCRFTGGGHDDAAIAGLRIGDAIALIFILPGAKEDIRIEGEVKRVQRDAQEVTIGVKFHDVADKTLKIRLSDFISMLEAFSHNAPTS